MITLSSDFVAPYPAAMRGVLAGNCTDRLIDVSHSFPQGGIRTAAFWIREILPYFPPAVHLVVIDPGVGTDRAVIVIEAGNHQLVGPDNGVMIPAARRLGGSSAIRVFELPSYDAASSTFHGRDVFAPLAAAVATKGIDQLLNDGLEPTNEFVEYALPTPKETADAVVGEVLVVDGFGNLITNIAGESISDQFETTVTINGTAVPAVESYAHVASGNPLATVGSHGNVELAVNGGRGDQVFPLAAGDRIRLEQRE